MQMLSRIEHFLLVARYGSFSAAARIGNITQPALTKSVRQLEATLGMELFLRRSTGVTLTEPGRVFYQRALQIEATWNTGLTELNLLKKGLGGKLRIGGGPVYSIVYFPRVMDGLLEAFPGLEIVVSTGAASELLPALKRGEIICYAGSVPRPEDGLGREFETLPLHRQVNALFVAKDHPLFALDVIRPEDLLNYSWLTLFAANVAASWIDSYFSRRNLPNPHVAIQSHSIQIALKMLTDHHFIACMPEPLAQAFPGSELREIEVEGVRWEAPTGLTYRKSMADFATISMICRLMKRHAGLSAANR
ncbi:LysR family transcriptional regulator [Natronohydrobacter thiooxidans]|uniref:LysR family transcriptional regulator n=1 Tax=Natronohydrobacter thiooxidans TaxID=87172 RepID=UPI0008FF0ECF|nr:LysR family transcriptional regulator [Natronohydrobacter thiooxidans]